MGPYGDPRTPRPVVRPEPPSSAPHLLAVGGGKGGVGKTLVTANLAAALAQAGRRVVAIDTDLEGANLHTVLGVPAPRVSLADFVAKRESDLRRLIVDTPIPGLRLIAGTNGHLGTPQPRSFRRVALLSELRKLPADHVLVDLGAGTHPSVMDYFLVGDDGILVMTPEPTSVENAYSFLRAAFYRRLRLAMTNESARKLVHQAMDQGNQRGIRTPLDLLREVRAIAPEEGDRFATAVQSFRPRIVVNAARTAEDVRLGFAVRSVCKKYFGIDADYVGYVNHDEAVTQAIRQRRPVVVTHPSSDAAVYLVRIARKLLDAARRARGGRPAPRSQAASTSSWARRPIA
ncbi:MAG: ATP-binding protein [Proteobacteria bacterium]|nr:MAG: ATP-binding protein [Pseudomonadota bacterium]